MVISVTNGYRVTLISPIKTNRRYVKLNITDNLML